MNNDFLPVSQKDLKKRGWDQLDIILITGDAYVDHPSYGTAVISRVLEQAGFKVGIIAQPDWRHTKDFTALGAPRLFFGITSGNTDSMIANYTANKKLRKTDDYSPGSKPGLRPDRALIVYANKVREIYDRVPIIIGGMEASLRRLAHYDYWDNKVRRSILLDARANILVYGMGERQVVEIAQRMDKGEKIGTLINIRGTVVVKKNIDDISRYLVIPSYEEIKDDKEKFNEAFRNVYSQMNPYTAKPLLQKHHVQNVIQLPPAEPFSSQELDRIYELPYQRNWHPRYTAQSGIKGFKTVEFSLISHRGCCGECSFCSLHLHQGRIIQSRSARSLIDEAKSLSERKGFYGVITDIGGPTANFWQVDCSLWHKKGFCDDTHCLLPVKCKNLKLGYKESLSLYKDIRALPKVKHVFIASGFRYDLLTEKYADEYLKEVCTHHISGQMKVAPEHVCAHVLAVMNKPELPVFEKFLDRFRTINTRLKKNQFLVNYFISSHPGSTLPDALTVSKYLAKTKLASEQIQDFIPSPLTLSTCIYYTGTHPFTGEKVYVPRTFHERKMQRALIQHKNPRTRKLLNEALRQLKGSHQIKNLLY
ncbi:MAG: YgiQ family radical SAM protein [Candidatus Omnitrophica bacterium]|nr:YgiQ family radical SAM protein [Candidatus Omnitrophota bacterium]